ncbi:MAG: hypothetical protein PF693_06525 [Spirochaetia bacterium]|jgi:hypothetical protein|nr:hypothetical protein [Spirochaetia bacterium]
MAIVSIGDILDKAAEFERILEKYYIEIRDNTSNNGVKLLTYYLSRHRRHLQEALVSIEVAELKKVRKVKLKYNIDFYLKKEFHPMKTPVEEVNGDELLDAAVGYDQKLIHLYEKIQEQPLPEEAKNIIGSLISIEHKDILMLKKTIATNYY